MSDLIPRTATLTPLRAVRKNCLSCCNGSTHEIGLCPAKACPIWPFRFGHKPDEAMIADQGDALLYPLEQQMTAAQFHANRYSPLRAIQRKCLDCSGASKAGVRHCALADCTLHPFRRGTNPNRAYTPEERARRAEHLARLKSSPALAENPVSIGDPEDKTPEVAPTTAAAHRRRW